MVYGLTLLTGAEGGDEARRRLALVRVRERLVLSYGGHGVVGFVCERGGGGQRERARARGDSSTNSGCGEGDGVQSARGGGGISPI